MAVPQEREAAAQSCFVTLRLFIPIEEPQSHPARRDNSALPDQTRIVAQGLKPLQNAGRISFGTDQSVPFRGNIRRFMNRSA
jgi:hypothetical protein